MESASLPLLPTAIALAGLLYGIYSLFIYPLLLHPLRNIPRAHWSVPYPYLGSAWILYQRYQMRNNATTHQAHLKKGSVVRLGYNELSVSCVDNGIRTIYAGGWEKHEWYARQFANFNTFNMFSTVHNTPHSQKKRVLSNIYAKSTLQASPQLRTNSHYLLSTRVLPLLQSLSQNGRPINIHSLNNGLTMDFASAYLLGIGNSTNFIQDVKAREQFLHTYHSRREYEWYSAEVSPSILRWARTLRINPVPGWVSIANDQIEEWISKMCTSAENYLQQHANEPNQELVGHEPIVWKQLKLGLAKIRSKDPMAGRESLPHIFDPTPLLSSEGGQTQMSRNELCSEILDHLAAGHETSAVLLTYLFWELSKHPSLQDRLHRELLTLEPAILWPLPANSDTKSFCLPDPRMIEGLPLLHAIVMESLRLHAPIPGTEPRSSPHIAGGSTLGEFSGIPGGVRVSSTSYVLHRNSEVFPEPECFNPDRWLTSDEANLKEMHRWFWAFGSGGRMCIGSNLAVQQIKLIVSALFSNWKTEIVDDDGIEPLDTYTTRPTSNKLDLKFIHR